MWCWAVLLLKRLNKEHRKPPVLLPLVNIDYSVYGHTWHDLEKLQAKTCMKEKMKK